MMIVLHSPPPYWLTNPAVQRSSPTFQHLFTWNDHQDRKKKSIRPYLTNKSAGVRLRSQRSVRLIVVIGWCRMTSRSSAGRSV
ncbi:hypothetical protein J6590_079977 [Homalodisca vitripennis]|nr:hypothetical protein J6590_079977 [Homalodisca vitripennis]